MSNKNKLRIFLYGSIILASLTFIYGRSLWHPLYLKIVGKKTEIEVYESISSVTENKLSSYFSKAKVPYLPEKITLIALKNERLLEIWATENNQNTFIHNYKFTGFSGKLGHKLKSGDNQIPEGLYELEYLNPNSSYHLSVKINYPNEYDVISAKKDGRSNLGGDIFIHGKSATIGCIPIGDENIEELFTLIYRIGLKNVRVIIAPNDMRNSNPKYKNSDIKWLNEKYEKIKSEMVKFPHS